MTSARPTLFTSTDDAEAFLIERLKLWALWVVALALITTLAGWWLILAAVAVLVNLGSLIGPLRDRAEVLVPEDAQVGGALQSILGRGTERDRLARRLMYSAGPLEDALAMTGRSPLWLVAHWGTLSLTVVAFVVVLYGNWL